MPPQRQLQKNKAAASTPNKASKPDRFTALLTVIRRGLGSQWDLYAECIERILEAAAHKQDTTAWFEQMQRLVGGNDQVHVSHEGMLFLLRDMGIRPSEQQSQIEGARHGSKNLSLHLSPPQANFIGPVPSSTAEGNFSPALSISNVSLSAHPPHSRQGQTSISEQGQLPILDQGQSFVSEQGQLPISEHDQLPISGHGQPPISEQGPPPMSEQGQKSMSEQGQTSNSRPGQTFSSRQGQAFSSRQGQTFSSRQGQTNLPVLAQWPVPRTTTPNTNSQQYVQSQVLKLRTKGLPFDVSARSILPELTYPRDLQAFFEPSEEIVLDPDRWVPRVSRFKPGASKNVRFFEDPTMKEKVGRMFGYSAKWRASIPNGPDDKPIRETDRLPYDPEDDDLAAWAANLEGDTEGEDEQMKASDHTTQWPLWKKRYDLEL
jgi:hypothetical protein